jgi:hypothetical protein
MPLIFFFVFLCFSFLLLFLLFCFDFCFASFVYFDCFVLFCFALFVAQFDSDVPLYGLNWVLNVNHDENKCYFQWDDDDVRFVLDQRCWIFNFSSLKQQPASRHAPSVGHTNMIPSQPGFALRPFAFSGEAINTKLIRLWLDFVFLLCLSSSCVLCTQCCQFFWIIHSYKLSVFWFSFLMFLVVFVDPTVVAHNL